MSSVPRQRPRLRAAAITLTVSIAVGGCSSTDDSPLPPVPTPSGEAAAICRALHAKLPEQVYEERRTGPSSETQYAADWGDPAIRLRCGVPRPEVLTPGSGRYNPTADAVEVNGIDWLLEKLSSGHRFTTTGRSVFVELTVPDTYSPEIGALPDLAEAVRETVPEKPL